MRFRYITPLIIFVLLGIAATATPALAGHHHSLRQLKKQLRQAKHKREDVRAGLQIATVNLAGARELFTATNPSGVSSTPSPSPSSPTPPAGMDQALAAALLADGVVTAEEITPLEERVTSLEKRERRWTVKIRRLQRRIRRLERIETWNRRGAWRPLVRIAGARYHVSATGLYRMMMLESGGRRTAGSLYKGLYQYLPSTWCRSWNPWRAESIYDGWSQIQATAYAISRGMGPSQWPNTYPRSF